MGDELKFAIRTHSEKLSEGILELLKANFQTDFKFLVNSEKPNQREAIKVHHFVLSIFCPDLRNVTEKKFNLEDNCNIDDLKSLVEFIYTGKTSIKPERLSNLKNGARLIGLHSLVRSINTYIKKQKDIESINATKQTPHHSQAVTQVPNRSSATVSSTSQPPILNNNCDAIQNSESAEKNSPISHNNQFDTTTDFTQPPISYNNYSAIQNSESAEKKVACKYCNFRAKRNWQLTSHMAIRHHLDADGNKVEKNVTCSKCSYTCYSCYQLKVHKRMKHCKVLIKCEQCPYVCATNSFFRKHMRSAHSVERPIMCEICGKAFKTMSNYREHMKTHQGLRVDCEICGKDVTVGSLRAHLQIHEISDRTFACHICSYAARLRPTLRHHLLNVHQVHMDKQGNIIDPLDDDSEPTMATEDIDPTDNAASNEIDNIELPLNSLLSIVNMKC